MILCDGHVHIHECYPLGHFLSSALKNFSSAATNLGLDAKQKQVQFVLWLTESHGMDKFSELLQQHREKAGSEWHILPTEEAVSLTVEHDEGEIILIAGRQIVSAEKIEMLALGTRMGIGDGAPLSETIESIIAADAIPVLPWGFGKWIGQRGKIVEETIRHYDDLWIGDNGGRLAGASEPKLFSLAKERKIPILPGSDPLPFPDEYRRVASYGWAFDGAVSKQRPGEELKNILRRRQMTRGYFGRLQPMGKFLQSQIKMQFIKRFGICH